MGITYEHAMQNVAALKAIGQTHIYLSEYDADPETFPWDRVSSANRGSTGSWLGPRDVRLTAEIDGLTFDWSVDFADKGLNKVTGLQSYYDRDKLLAVMRRIPEAARLEFADYLEREVLPPLSKAVAEQRKELSAMAAGENTVAELIALGRA